MNIDRITLSIDDKDLQNQVKFQLIEAIVSGDIKEFGCENIIVDAWDEKTDMMGKAYTGEQILRVRVRTKETEEEDIRSMPRAVIDGCSFSSLGVADADLRLTIGCSHNYNLGSICTVELCPRLSKKGKIYDNRKGVLA